MANPTTVPRNKQPRSVVKEKNLAPPVAKNQNPAPCGAKKHPTVKVPAPFAQQQPPTAVARDVITIEESNPSSVTGYLDIALLTKQLVQIRAPHVCRLYRDHPRLFEPLQKVITTVNTILGAVKRISVDKPQRIRIAHIFRKTVFAFTLNLAQLSWAMLKQYKIIENRDKQWNTGWYAVHTGVESRALSDKQKKHSVDLHNAMPNTKIPNENDLVHRAILGLVHICERRRRNKCGGCVWAKGKWCHIIDMTIKLSRPVYCRGFVGIWPITAENRLQIYAQVNDVKVLENDLSVLM